MGRHVWDVRATDTVKIAQVHVRQYHGIAHLVDEVPAKLGVRDNPLSPDMDSKI